jgi:hypothetical protein
LTFAQTTNLQELGGGFDSDMREFEKKSGWACCSGRQISPRDETMKFRWFMDKAIIGPVVV